MSIQKFNILDLFSGAGGFSSGLEYNKYFSTKIAVDFDKYACKTFENNFGNAIVINEDISIDSIKKKITDLAKKNNINMIIGGPPCQGFSLKGKRMGFDDQRNHLFEDFLQIVEIIKPEIYVIENVVGIISSEKGYFINKIMELSKKMGYKVTINILNAKYFNVPQDRKRVFIICSKTNEITIENNTQNKTITVRDAISDLSYLESGEGTFESDYKLDAKSIYQKNMRYKKLYNHVATKHSEKAIAKLKLIPAESDKKFLPEHLLGNQKFSTTWSRLIWDDVSPTIDTRFDTPSNGRNSHPELHRSITPREAARIQSFKDSFIFYGPKTSICKQIGNAVPPNLAYEISKKIAQSYNLKG